MSGQNKEGNGPMAKLGVKEKYHAMTRDLMWEPKDFDMNKVYPLIDKEGIILKDPSRWEDPFPYGLQPVCEDPIGERWDLPFRSKCL